MGRGTSEVKDKDLDAADHPDLSSSPESDDAARERNEMGGFKDACWAELCAIADGSGQAPESGGNIAVGFRIRPPRAVESADMEPCVFSVGKEISIVKPGSAEGEHTFAYDCTFDGESRQFDVFKALGWPCVRNAWIGFNISIFAYGQTGSGKSHSMMGTEDNPGLIRSTGNLIFDFLARSGFGGGVSISCIEIYNEQIRDILAPFMEKGGPVGIPSNRLSIIRSAVRVAKALGVTSTASNLKIRETAGKGVYVEGLCSCPVGSTDELSQCINGATDNREVRATNMNATSSRSHLIFMVELEVPGAAPEGGGNGGADGATEPAGGRRRSSFMPSMFGSKAGGGGGGATRRAKMNLIDLAGSERSKATGATGQSLKEGANINKSLSTLGRVIAALSSPGSKQMPPFRDSKLTHILKDALAGNSVTSMLATAHASAVYYEETLSTLRYASSIKKIKTSAAQVLLRLRFLFFSYC